MALEVLSGVVYHDPVNVAPKQRAETNAQEINATNINITEVSAAKVSGANQSEKDYGNGQNPNSPTDQQFKNAVNMANNKMKTCRTRCEFSYHEETKRISIKVLNSETHEVIKEIPPEETLDMIQKMWDLAGILIDEKR